MRSQHWKVGELAQKTGLSVRALHYYEEIGLLRPSHRTASGHRLYTAGDVARLSQIKSLRALGLGLEEIRAFLERPSLSPLEIIERHLGSLRMQIAEEQKLCIKLEGIAQKLRAGEETSVEQLLQMIEVSTMIEKYYTPEQLEELKARREAMGEAAMRQAERDWQQLFEELRVEMEKGTDPKSEVVQRLMARSEALIEAFTGGNPEIRKSLERMYKEEPSISQRIDPRIAEYMGKARR
jgi:MerR family transcriptional regulator, thiopeptide resistance regulator